jgi:hypothetical protein
MPSIIASDEIVYYLTLKEYTHIHRKKIRASSPKIPKHAQKILALLASFKHFLNGALPPIFCCWLKIIG